MESRRKRRLNPIGCLLVLIVMAAIVVGVYYVVSLPISLRGKPYTGIPGLVVQSPTPVPTPTVDAASRLSQADDLFQQGQFRLAAREYEAITILDPHNAIAFIRLTKALALSNQSAEAVKIGEQAVTLAPNSTEAYANLGMAYSWNAQVDKAFAACLRAIELDPNYAPAYAFLGEAYADKTRWQKALEAAEKAVQLDEQSFEAHRSLGYVLERQAKHSAAISEYEKALELRPYFAYIHRDLGRMYRDYPSVRDDERAMTCFRNAIQLEPDEPRGHWGLAVVYYNRGDYEEALFNLKKAAAADPNYYPAFSLSGWAYYRTRDYLSAIDNFETALRIKQDDPNLIVGLGWSYLFLERYQEAKDQFDKALSMDPNLELAKQGLESLRARGYSG